MKNKLSIIQIILALWIFPISLLIDTPYFTPIILYLLGAASGIGIIFLQFIKIIDFLNQVENIKEQEEFIERCAGGSPNEGSKR